MSGGVFEVDGEPVRLCGVHGSLTDADLSALAEIVRSAKAKWRAERAEQEKTPEGREKIARGEHHQMPRSDGSWGCRCGWEQDKPHAEHVAEMVAAARAES